MKKAQFWYGDFLIAVLILMIIGLLFVSSMMDITSRNEIIKELILDASDISAVLMSEGYRDIEQWREGIGTVGFITDYELNRDKFLDFIEMDDYNIQKSLLGTYNDFWIYLKNKESIIDSSNRDYNSVEDIDADNLVHIKRFVFYQGEIHILGVVVWN